MGVGKMCPKCGQVAKSLLFKVVSSDINDYHCKSCGKFTHQINNGKISFLSGEQYLDGILVAKVKRETVAV